MEFTYMGYVKIYTQEEYLVQKYIKCLSLTQCVYGNVDYSSEKLRT